MILLGNHDITLDTKFYAQYGSYFHTQNPQDVIKSQGLLQNSSSIIWLRHESTVIKLLSPDGPRTTFKVFGSPFSPEKGMWAFGYKSYEAGELWSKIPLDTDIVVTHTPLKYHCDETREREAAGCEALRQALWRVRPRMSICGHVHEGRGVQRVNWDLESPNCKFKESFTESWVDPGKDNNKFSLVDLTGKIGNPIRNDGAIGDYDPSHSTVAERIAILGLGVGGLPPSSRCDLEALSGRMSRLETCVVNAAIMKSSWSHGTKGKTFNKPIVVDVDLPTWAN